MLCLLFVPPLGGERRPHTSANVAGFQF